MNTAELASRILTQLGFYQEPSKEIGIDDRRDNIVHLIEEYAHPAKTLTDEEIIESLAELEHQQWIQWASTIMQTEKISDGRIARWKDCFKPYSELSEEMKEHDRAWARKALAILRKAQEK